MLTLAITFYIKVGPHPDLVETNTYWVLSPYIYLTKQCAFLL